MGHGAGRALVAAAAILVAGPLLGCSGRDEAKDQVNASTAADAAKMPRRPIATLTRIESSENCDSAGNCLGHTTEVTIAGKTYGSDGSVQSWAEGDRIKVCIAKRSTYDAGEDDYIENLDRPDEQWLVAEYIP